jgi:hypothetical protein
MQLGRFDCCEGFEEFQAFGLCAMRGFVSDLVKESIM